MRPNAKRLTDRSKDAYARAGVDTERANEAVARYRALLGQSEDVTGNIGAFAGSFPLHGFREPVLVASTDGVGTKVLLAAALGGFESIGRDLVQHCINDVLCLNARPLFFLDYLAAGRLDAAMAESVVRGIAGSCEQYGVVLLGGETAEMPGLYQPSHFDLAGTIVGAVERAGLLDVHAVRAGDLLIGLPANGFHTNGYALVRKTLGPERWQETVPGTAVSVASALLAVHPCYLPYVRAIQAASVSIKGMAHITGGGLAGNLPRMLPGGLAARLQSARWTVPRIVAQVVSEAQLDRAQAYRTFNMGVGFCVAVAAADAPAAVQAANECLRAQPIESAEIQTAGIIGEIEPRLSEAPPVRIE